MQMPGQVNALTNHEEQRHAQAAKHLEVHPDALERKGNEQIGKAADQEEDDPGNVEAYPDHMGQGHGMAQHPLDQRFVTNEMTADEGQGKQPVDHRRFPFQEGFAVERQGHATKHQTGHQRQPLAFLQMSLLDEKDAIDDD